MSVQFAINESNRILDAAKFPDTEENFRLCCQKIGETLTPEMVAPYRREWKPRVAFYLPSTAKLAHRVNLQTLVGGLRDIGDPIEYEIWAYGKPDDEFTNAFGSHKPLCDWSGDLIKHWKNFQERGHHVHLDAVIHVSNASNMAWGAGIRCARKHLWWVQKWDGPFHGIDGIIDGRDPTLDGVGWKRSPPGPMVARTYTALPELHREDLRAKATSLRRGYYCKTLYGVFARDEKFSPEFIDCCQRIAGATKGEGDFVYASRGPVSGMPGQHLGWLSPDMLSTYIQAVDVMLETFPFAGGHITFEAMASRKPVVFMRIPKGGQVFAGEMMERHGFPVQIADTADEYVSTAAQFDKRDEYKTIYDTDYDARAFFERHLRDEKRMATEFTEAVRGLI